MSGPPPSPSSSGHPTGTPPLARVAVGGVIWQGTSFLVGKLITLGATIVLARVLVPEDFGLVALALVFVAFVEDAADLGVAQALIYFPRDRRNEDTALTLSLLSGLAFALIGFVTAPAVADFFGRPDVEPIFRVLSASLILSSLRQVPDALLRRELAFRRRVTGQLTYSLAQGLVSIGAVAAGLGAWAIVWGYVAGNLAWACVAWALVDYRPGRRFWRVNGSTVRTLIGYGAPAAGAGVLASIIFDVDYVIVGRVLGAEELGEYALAFRIPQLLIINVFFVLSAVAFPMFSRTRDDAARLRRGYLTSLRLQTTYGVAAGVGLFMAAPILVPAIFGDKWEDSVAPLQALALYAVCRSLGFGAVDLYKGTGRPWIAAIVNMARLAVLVPALLLAAQHGITTVAWTQAAVALVFAIGMQSVALRVLHLPVREFFTALRPAAAMAIGMVVGVGAVRWGIAAPGLVQLAAAGAAGTALGLVALWLVDANFVRDVRALLGGRRRATATVSA